MPGVRVTSVRRTVVVAGALVAGQALLCGIIGFVTFGGGDDKATGARAAEPLAGPPVVLPPPSDAPDGEPAKRARTADPRSTRSRRPPAPKARRSSATLAISPSRTLPVPVVPSAPPTPVPSTSPTDRSLLPPSVPAPAEDTPAPVVDEQCDVEGLIGRTADDKAVRCERGPDGDLRWRLV
jgi:hypothetical protein